MLVYWARRRCHPSRAAEGRRYRKDDAAVFGQKRYRVLAARFRLGDAKPRQPLWPRDQREPKPVPANASIKGEQFVHGSATPAIRFTIGDKQDFLSLLEASAKGSFPARSALGWSAISNSQGYFLQAMADRQATGEMIIWTFSEIQDTGWGLMTWLPNDFLRRMIAEKVVLPPDVTHCMVPKDVSPAFRAPWCRPLPTARS